MKVLYLLDHLGSGGTQTFVCQMAYVNSLERKIEIEIASLFGRDCYSSRLKELGCKITFLSHKNYNYLNILNPILIRRLLNYVKKNDSDLIDIRSYAAFFFCSIAKIYKIKKTIFSIEASFKQMPKILFWVYKLFADNYRYCFSSYPEEFQLLKTKVCEHLIAKGGISNSNELSNEMPADIPTGFNLYVFSVGRLHHSKNHQFAINVIKYLVEEKERNACLLVFGDGNYENKLRKKVHKLGLSNNVFFMGHKANLDHYYQYATCLIKASKGEAFNLTAVNAIYNKVLVFCSLEHDLDICLGKKKVFIPINRYSNTSTGDTIYNQIMKGNNSEIIDRSYRYVKKHWIFNTDNYDYYKNVYHKLLNSKHEKGIKCAGL